MALRIECTDVAKRYGKTPVLDNLSWTVAPGELVGLLGGSGAGKTTLLRLIAALEDCSAGKVSLSTPGSLGTPGVIRPRGKPPVGMVFQDLALWPHLTARRHLRCVLWRLPRRQRGRRAEAVLAETRLPPEAWNRRPAQLSGGEAQRLALARALAPEPELLLLDEPLAQVDTTLRADLLESIGRVVRSRGVTAIYVTHNWREAMRLCPRIAVIDGGRIAIDGTPEEVYWNPPTPRLARLTGPVVELPKGLLDGRLITLAERPPDGPMVVRPQQLRPVEPAGENCWKLTGCRPEGAGWTLTAVCGPHRLSVPSTQPMQPGKSVGIELRTAKEASSP